MRTHDPEFKPPFCPRPTCRYHRDPTGWVYHADGTHARKAWPHVIRRFRCSSCHRCFSTQTFDTTYWLERPDIQPVVLLGLAGGSCFRQVARELGVVHSTVLRQSERLGRHCLLFQQDRRPKVLPDEHLVLDGLQTFEYSQYWPCDFNVLVGRDSHFFHAFTDAELRRSGRMKPRQAKRRQVLEERHGKPDPRATEKEVEQLLRLVLPEPAAATLFSDEHPSYPRAIERLDGYRIEHQRVPSKRARTPDNPLFPANLLDLLLRHGSKNHTRETIAFSKRRQNAAERLAIFQVWRNFMKRFSEKRSDSPSPAMKLGLTRRLLGTGDVLRRRLFPSLVELPARWQRYYDREIETRQIPNGRRHLRWQYIY